MKISKETDIKKCEQIAKNCGSKAVKQSVSYIGKMAYYNPKAFVCVTIDDKAFFAGSIGKKHFRLYELAVLESEQRKGYGQACIKVMRQICKKHNLEKITFRTSKQEDAVLFYEKQGGVIVGTKGDDWEMEIRV